MRIKSNKPNKDITIKHIQVACRQYNELRKINLDENNAIRLVEHLIERYCVLLIEGKRNRPRTKDVKLWSIKALKLKKKYPDNKFPKGVFTVEHGTPKRAFTRMALDLYDKGNLDEKRLRALAKNHWKVAIITCDEDKSLTELGVKSERFNTPYERWSHAKISFPKT